MLWGLLYDFIIELVINKEFIYILLSYTCIYIFLLFQDTVLGLQALSEFGFVASADLDLNIDVNADNFSQSIRVTKSDAMVLKLVDVSPVC